MNGAEVSLLTIFGSPEVSEFATWKIEERVKQLAGYPTIELHMQNIPAKRW